MMNSVPGAETSQTQQSGPDQAAIRQAQIMKMQSKRAADLQFQVSEGSKQAHLRRELDALRFNTERAIANEEASRTMSRIFSKFSLLQKIMQTMS